MIQRIQTVYLLLSTICAGLLTFIPIGKIDAEGTVKLVSALNLIPLLGLAILSGLISLLSIFLYRNRVLQKNVVLLNVFITFGAAVLIGYYFFVDENVPISQLGVGAGLPILTMVLLVLAHSHIRKDENLVRSMDRLR